MSLDFQNFESVNSVNEQGGAFGGNIGDRNILVDSGGAAGGGGAPFSDSASTTSRRGNMLSWGYYQQFFDVETDQVVKRVLNSVVPTHRNYITEFLQPIPDLWGPFWISITLVFAIGVFGNLAQFIENEGAKGEYGSDFRMVTSASTLIFLYVVLVPLFIYGLLWHRRSEQQHPYVDLVCLYGYSLSIFVPVSMLWIVDINWFRWGLIFVSVTLSGGVIARALWPAVQNDSNKAIAFGTIVIVLLLHFLLAFSFKEFFFDAMHPKAVIVETTTIDVPTTPPLPAGVSLKTEADDHSKKVSLAPNVTTANPNANVAQANQLTNVTKSDHKRDSAEQGAKKQEATTVLVKVEPQTKKKSDEKKTDDTPTTTPAKSQPAPKTSEKAVPKSKEVTSEVKKETEVPKSEPTTSQTSEP